MRCAGPWHQAWALRCVLSAALGWLHFVAHGGLLTRNMARSVALMQDLDMVAAQAAQSIVVVSDQSRCPEEADAQSLRCGACRGRAGVRVWTAGSGCPEEADAQSLRCGA